MPTANTISKSDIISAITIYLASNERPCCPMNYLVDEKFGKQNKKLITKLVTELKQAGAIIGKRGRTGGLCFPENIAVEAEEIETVEDTEVVEECEMEETSSSEDKEYVEESIEDSSEDDTQEVPF